MALTNEEDFHSKSSSEEIPLNNQEIDCSDEEKSLTTINEENSQIDDDEDQIKITRAARLKTRSVSFAPTVDTYEIPARSCWYEENHPIDFLDVLVESYKMETSTNFDSLFYDEKQYVPKTSRTRSNPNWREHRIRHLMNKLEELSLWDRDEEMKESQAKFLREQKLEQIQDRQRNQDLCLKLMRQRHESEMESAILLDRSSASGPNEETTRLSIKQALSLPSTRPVPLTKTLRQQLANEENFEYKTPAARFRQFQTKMDKRLENIHQRSANDRPLTRQSRSIPTTVVPLFSETYGMLLKTPETFSSRRKFSPDSLNDRQTSSPDFEQRSRLNSRRDVRVPLKDQSDDESSDNDDDQRRISSRETSSSPLRRLPYSRSLSTFSLNSRSTVDPSFIRSRSPLLNSIHQRTLNDDFNSLTRYPLANSKKIVSNYRQEILSSDRFRSR